jgi:hypothetical protein
MYELLIVVHSWFRWVVLLLVSSPLPYSAAGRPVCRSLSFVRSLTPSLWGGFRRSLVPSQADLPTAYFRV